MLLPVYLLLMTLPSLSFGGFWLVLASRKLLGKFLRAFRTLPFVHDGGFTVCERTSSLLNSCSALQVGVFGVLAVHGNRSGCRQRTGQYTCVKAVFRNSCSFCCVGYIYCFLFSPVGWPGAIGLIDRANFTRRLDWTMIEFQDNQPVIDLVSKKPRGLLIQLEEQGLLGRRANNKALLQVRSVAVLDGVLVCCLERFALYK